MSQFKEFCNDYLRAVKAISETIVELTPLNIREGTHVARVILDKLGKCDPPMAVESYQVDDDKPVTVEWLRSMGFIQDEWHDKKMKFDRVDNLAIGLWNVDDGWKAMLIHHEAAASCLIRKQNTRCKVRNLCRALGIDLKEGDK